MKNLSPIVALVAVCLSAVIGACAPAPEASPSSSMSTTTLCSVGSQACYCPDGQLTGTQYCDSRQELSGCICPTGNAPTNGDPTRVCAELANVNGCDGTSYVSPEVPASILFVVDRSGSMACNHTNVQSVADCEADPKRLDPNQPSRWETTIAALNEAFAGLAGNQATLGLSMFSTDGYCGADSTPIVGVDVITPTHLQALSAAFAAATPAGGTPIVGATVLAYNHLHQELRAPGNRYVVLITDGGESCGTQGDNTNTDDLASARNRLLETEVLKARDANIKTFVIGAPGSDAARGFLSELAYLGGTARDPNCQHPDRNGNAGNCHFDLTTETDFATVLRDTLGEISGEALGCEFQTPSGGSRQINVQYSQSGAPPVCFGYDPAPCDGGADGWQFAKKPDGSDDLARVVLCGPACAAVKQDPTTVVDVILGCEVLE